MVGSDVSRSIDSALLLQLEHREDLFVLQVLPRDRERAVELVVVAPAMTFRHTALRPRPREQQRFFAREQAELDARNEQNRFAELLGEAREANDNRSVADHERSAPLAFGHTARFDAVLEGGRVAEANEVPAQFLALVLHAPQASRFLIRIALRIRSEEVGRAGRRQNRGRGNRRLRALLLRDLGKAEEDVVAGDLRAHVRCLDGHLDDRGQHLLEAGDDELQIFLGQLITFL